MLNIIIYLIIGLIGLLIGAGVVLFLNKDKVDPATVEKEKTIALEQARQNFESRRQKTIEGIQKANQSKIEELEESNGQKQAQITELQAKIVELEPYRGQVGELQATIGELEPYQGQVRELQAQIEELEPYEGQVRELQAQIGEIELYQSQVSKLQAKVAQLEPYQSQVTELQAKLEEVEQLEQSYQAQLQENKQSLRQEYESQIQQLREELGQKTNQVSAGSLSEEVVLQAPEVTEEANLETSDLELPELDYEDSFEEVEPILEIGETVDVQEETPIESSEELPSELLQQEREEEPLAAEIELSSHDDDEDFDLESIIELSSSNEDKPKENELLTDDDPFNLDVLLEDMSKPPKPNDQ